MTAVYDAGMLIAADRNDRSAWADHRVRLELGVPVLVTAPVVAQVSRAGTQASLRRLLRGCETVAFAPDEAHPTGDLLARADSSDVVDAHVVIVAAAHRATIITSDPTDMLRLAGHVDVPLNVVSV